jgi:hypothetical protein
VGLQVNHFWISDAATDVAKGVAVEDVKSKKIAQCKSCPTMMRWNRMHTEKVCQECGVDEVSGEQLWTSFYVYTCWECKAKDWACTVEEARARVMDEGGYALKRKERVDKWEASKKENKQKYEAAGLDAPTGRKLYRLTLESFQVVFEEVGDLIMLKVRQLTILKQEVVQHKELVELLRHETDPRRVKELLDQIEVLNQADMELLGFKKEGGKQMDLWTVSTYQDEVSGHAGSRSSFRYYFVCLAGGSQWRCMHAMTSKGWRTKHDASQGWVKGQRWYCPICSAGFKTAFGVLVEVHVNGQLHYMRAKIPDDTSLDIQALNAERKHFKQGMASAELFNALPTFHMAVSTFVQETHIPGAFKLRAASFFDSLPVFDWVEVLRFAGGE